MAGPIPTGADALVVDAKDHVATSLRELKRGESASYRLSDEVKRIEVLEDIPFGHKIAIMDIEKDTHIRKYGETIGLATMAIAAGAHVHVHNVESIRGRGDQAAQGGQKA
ncbi:altronate dehydratase small subunit [Paenibacillus phyllosphaerae]|uniref:Altronate dehydratase small subunit n=1 Tax=Paenibacillus phyllosphaerae TaxID=274593 RepID=A0A7W5AYU0_9BACL|nr:UxaA family hydrolase [Paenibacillus phyllosphaerae]MBB3111300.1 altronate dehydratase small subunit [Paenibacillus phyllosphaerae]